MGRKAVRSTCGQSIQQHLCRAPLRIGAAARKPGRIALPVAGDDAEAKAVVLRLIDELGFDGVDAGGLDESWRQQPDTPVYAIDFDAERCATCPREGEQGAQTGVARYSAQPGYIRHPGLKSMSKSKSKSKAKRERKNKGGHL